ncbi:MAG TPA: S53 family peptidase [Ktedonobacterales bacterium]
MTRVRSALLALVGVVLLGTACAPTTVVVPKSASPTATATVGTTLGTSNVCPLHGADPSTCFTPHSLREAYGMQALVDQGDTGKGVTVVVVVSYGNPNLQQDLDAFSRMYGLPALQVPVYSPLGAKPSDPGNADIPLWGLETELDVESIHAMAPGAGIVVVTSPVDETESTIGLPQFMQIEQYAVQHHLGQVFSQSWAASEATLTDSASQQFVKTYDAFYQQITTQDGITVLAGSGDNGATDCATISCAVPGQGPDPAKLATTPTVNFPASSPWVVAVGGTSLGRTAQSYTETAWQGSGGGVSKFETQPAFQQGLPSAVQSVLHGHRGLPDVAANADPGTSMAYLLDGQWTQIGGTSEATPLWAGIVAVADQVAGHPLGLITPGLYKLGLSATAAQDYRDITSGDNSNTSAPKPVQGYQAGAGWDEVTGWGAPLADHFIPDLIAALG